MLPSELQALLGGIDIYWLDQILRGRLRPGMAIFDAGCGGGRNLVYLLRAGFEVAGVDAQVRAVAGVRELAAALAPQLSGDYAGGPRFRAEPLENHSFPDESFDAVVSSAVLHFARDHDHFRALLEASWRPLRRGGLFFCRLASTIGIAHLCEDLGHGRFRLPDGSNRYLVDEAELARSAAELGGTLADPLKTTVVQNQRSMTTWVLRRDV